MSLQNRPMTTTPTGQFQAKRPPWQTGEDAGDELAPYPVTPGRGKRAGRLLVTGSSGGIGRVVTVGLRARGHFVRGADLKPGNAELDEFHAMDLGDADKVTAAAETMDTIVHLGGKRYFNELDDGSRRANLDGVYHVYEAAREAGVGRVILASSVNVVLPLATSGRTVTVDDADPRNHYALLKLWAEGVARMYWLEHGIATVVLRIAAAPRTSRDVRWILNRERLAYRVSHRDLQRAFVLATEADRPKFAKCYVASRQDGVASPLDLEPGRRAIGYEPRDNFLEGLMFTPRIMEELASGDAECGHVGRC